MVYGKMKSNEVETTRESTNDSAAESVKKMLLPFSFPWQACMAETAYMASLTFQACMAFVLQAFMAVWLQASIAMSLQAFHG